MARSVARDIEFLPYWASVAFAARCGRLTLPLFTEAWPNVEPSRTDSLKHAIEFAERSAADGRLAIPSENPVMKAMATAGAAISSLYGTTGNSQSPIGERNSLIAHYVAKAAESAARTAQDGAKQSRSGFKTCLN